MRSRNRLHKSKLTQFSNWLEWHGWTPEKTKGLYEVMRKRKGDELLLVYDRNEAKEHYTTYDVSERELSRWLNQRKVG